jgi:ribonuclease Z
MHDIEDYHITPEQAAMIANEAGVKLLVYYHLLPAPDGFVSRRLFAQGINEARDGDGLSQRMAFSTPCQSDHRMCKLVL